MIFKPSFITKSQFTATTTSQIPISFRKPHRCISYADEQFTQGSCGLWWINLIQVESTVLVFVVPCWVTAQREIEIRDKQARSERLLIQWRRLFRWTVCWGTAIKGMRHSSYLFTVIHLDEKKPMISFRFLSSRTELDKCLISLFLFNSRVDVLKRSVEGLVDNGVELLRGQTFTNSELLNSSLNSKLEWADTACSSHYESVRRCFRIGENLYMLCTWAMKDWKLLEMLLIWEAIFVETSTWRWEHVCVFQIPD